MSPFDRIRARLQPSLRNALEIARLGRLADPYGAPHSIIDRGEHHRLRQYATAAPDDAPAALLVPPLMVTAEVYDISPDTSAVMELGRRGVQPFVIDFGAPEREEHGLERTLDDHLEAVVRSVERVRAKTGRDVHLLGYSQGGMFAYQAAAYLRSAGIGSIVTFGSPVDIHRGLPALSSKVTGALARTAEPFADWMLDRVQGLPGTMTSAIFKMLSPRKEIEARLEFLRKLHDRSALARREGRRRFLNGEGFVAWPGAALRVFIDEFIVHNRMLHGGFVIGGRSVTLADITSPILAFVGASDEIARPATVKAIAQAAPLAEVDFVTVRAGHFGLVVGSRSMQTTWPTVADWIHWREGHGPKPAAIRDPTIAPPADDLDLGDFDIEIDLLLDTLARTVKSGVRRINDAIASASDAVAAVKYQEPRLRRLASLEPDTRVSPAYELSQRAAQDPGATFFLWRDRAFSYRDADARVTNVAKGLYACGVRPGDRVAVLMGSRPSFLSMVSALSRLGAVAVIASPDADPAQVRRALRAAGTRFHAVDPDGAERWASTLAGPLLVLGGGGAARTLAPRLMDMEAIDPAKVDLPRDLELNAGRARDLGMILLRPTESGELRAAPITNHRWALSALAAGAACTLKPGDTVLSCVPLHHPTGILVSVGGAVVGGARLALAERFEPSTFFADARRVGATVVFYSGEMLRPLLFEPPSRSDLGLPIRLFAGSGMRRDLAARLRERFTVDVLEFYASTSQRVVLASASGMKAGSLGRTLPGSAEIAIVRIDWTARRAARDANGHLVRVVAGEAGLLASRASAEDTPEPDQVRGSFLEGDAWIVSNDVVSEDADGDAWFVDSLAGFVSTPGGPVSTRKVEDALYDLPEVELAAAFAREGGGIAMVVVAREPLEAGRVRDALAKLAEHERPGEVAQVDSIPLTDGFRPRKRAAAAELARGRVVVSAEAGAGAS